MRLNGASDESASAGIALFNHLSKQKKAQSATPAGMAGQENPASPIETQSSDNMLSSLFVHDEAKTSRYVQANMDSMRNLSAMKNRQNNIVQMGKMEQFAAKNVNELVMIGKKAEERLDKEKDTTVNENSETVLDEARKDLEERAEEAINPVDENGNPVADRAETSPESIDDKAPSEDDTLLSETPGVAPGETGAPATDSRDESAASSEQNATGTQEPQKRVDLMV